MPPIIEPAVYRGLIQLGAGHPFSLQEPQLDKCVPIYNSTIDFDL